MSKLIGPMVLCVMISVATQTIAQDAFISQIGDRHRAANLSTVSDLSIYQSGRANAAAQIVVGEGNLAVTIQDGEQNQSAAAIIGQDNTFATVQLGAKNASTTFVSGDRNLVGMFQDGNLNQSRLSLTGNDARIGVVQVGVGRKSDVTIVDDIGGFEAAVLQGPSSDPVWVNIYRDSAGTTMVQPGTATTILQFR
jgi:hypothetical protein